MKVIICICALLMINFVNAQSKIIDDYGPVTVKELKDKEEWFSPIYNYYKVDSLELANIKEIDKMTFKIFLGTWCSDSKVLVPKFIKVLDYLKVPKKNIKLINVNHSKSEPKKMIEKYNVKYLPTIIFYKGDKEFNRIIEFTEKSIEKYFIKSKF
ncbi:MAG: thioredoxin family protein [Cellulophaga sp.]|uniref:thioredoxin family protein n=1 Tax=unclassified Cellulophaga TaxID=2634405 RepID=UPI0026E298E0|nr:MULTISPECIES: thioredoxin family protein [unclassified Cellulophaga]MDO6491193.1 thioredoxin family protein [Cellulophaga sp. 2_MG-2023]MDO6495274.1 thioredoxin family protein [Cellulophaga sp. 3_MG-2023]